MTATSKAFVTLKSEVTALSSNTLVKFVIKGCERMRVSYEDDFEQRYQLFAKSGVGNIFLNGRGRIYKYENNTSANFTQDILISTTIKTNFLVLIGNVCLIYYQISDTMILNYASSRNNNVTISIL